MGERVKGKAMLWVVTALLALAVAESAMGQASNEAEIRETRSRLVQKPGVTPAQGVFAISNRYANFVAKLTTDGWARGAFPSINAILDLDVTFTPAAATTTYAIEPFIVERTYAWSGGLAAKSYWFSTPDSALVVALFHFRNDGTQSASLRVQQRGVFRVGHADAYQARPDNTGSVNTSAKEVKATNSTYTDLFCKVRYNFPGAPAIINTDTGQPAAAGVPTRLGYTQDGNITLAPGEQAQYWIALTGGRTGEQEFPFSPSTSSINTALAATRAWQAERIDHAPTLETQDEDLNAFFLWNKIWPWRTEHDLPLGSPHLISSRDNSRARVLSAATGLNWDYYGIWANDCVQTLWECGALGHEFYPVIAGTLETAFRHGAPESIELPMPDGKPFYVFLKLASKPEWAMGAANYLLWCNDQAEFDRVWPQIRLTLQSFRAENDWDRDWLDDSAMWPFPEQPSVGTYNHEMLYASCYWYAGFDAAARAARLYNRTAEAADLEWQRDQIKAAINSIFITDYGYASWLDRSHAKHPHKGHNQVFTVQYGIAPPEQAEKVFQNQLNPPIVTDYGPRTGDMGVGDMVWNYNRWNMVHGLYNYGHAEEAFQWLKRFVGQEAASTCHYQGPEGFTPTGGITTQGLVWGAGRAMRAIYFGLVGLSLEGAGVRFRPQPPGAWSGFQLLNLEVRGAVVNLTVQRGSQAAATFDGQPISEGLVPNSMLTPGAHQLVITLTSGDGTVSGRVTNRRTGAALQGAKVEVVGDPSRSATTNANGEYSIAVPPAPTTLSVSLEGYLPASRLVNVGQGQTLAGVDFKLSTGVGETFHVSPTGDDSKDGLTLATAWATVDKGDRDRLLYPADTVIVEAGTYSMSGSDRVLANCSGQAGGPITYRANGGVVLDRGANPGTVLGILGPSAGNIVLDGFQFKGGSVGLHVAGAAGIRVINCRFSDKTVNVNAPMIWLVGASNCSIHNNVIGPNLAGYTHGIVDDSSGGNNKFYKNTIIGTTDWAFVVGGSVTNALGIEFRNNIIYQVTNGIFTINPSLAHTHNMFYDLSGTMYQGTGVGAGETTADPKFVNAAARDFHLQIGSPAIDAGFDVGLPFNGTAPDLGAFETGTPVTSSQIGALRQQPDGTLVRLTATVTAGSGRFAGQVVYVEDESRAAGIRVVAPLLSPALAEGEQVCVEGALTTINGERVIVADTIAKLGLGSWLMPFCRFQTLRLEAV